MSIPWRCMLGDISVHCEWERGLVKLVEARDIGHKTSLVDQLVDYSRCGSVEGHLNRIDSNRAAPYPAGGGCM